jgi:hypothetical protein
MLETLRRDLSPAEARGCEKTNCKLPLDGLRHPTFILDCDIYRGLRELAGEICDFLVFVCGATLTGAAVEMKSGAGVDARKAARQIQGGANELGHIVGVQRVSFYPILLHSGIKHTNELKVLQNRKVVFRGENYRIIYKRCGTRLLDIIEQFP